MKFCIGLTLLVVTIFCKAQEAKLVLPEGHSSLIRKLNFSANGRYLLSASEDKTAKIWDVNSGKLIRTLKGHGEQLTSAAFSNDFKKVVTTANNSEPIIWNAESGEKIASFEILRWTKNYCYAEFSWDDKNILTAVANKKQALLFDAYTGRVNKVLSGKEEVSNIADGYSIDCMDLKPKLGNAKKYIFLNNYGDSIQIWDAKTLNYHGVIKRANKAKIIDFEVDEKDSLIVTISKDSVIEVFDLSLNEIKLRLPINNSVLRKAIFISDSKYLVIALADSTIYFWDINSKKSANNGVLLDEKIATIIARKSSNCFLSISNNYKKIRLFEWRDNKLFLIRTLHLRNGVTAVCYNHSGTKIAIADYNRIWVVKSDDLTILHEFDNEAVMSKQMAINSVSNFIALKSSSIKFSIRNFDVINGKIVNELIGHNDVITSAAYNKVGSMIASSSLDGTIKLWDVKKGKCLSTSEYNSLLIDDLRFSNNGNYLASTHDNKRIIITDIKTNMQLCSIEETQQIKHFYFSATDKEVLYACLDGTFKIVSIATKTEIKKVHLSEYTNGLSRPIIKFDKQNEFFLFAYGNEAIVYDAIEFKEINKIKFNTNGSSSFYEIIDINFGSLYSQVQILKVDGTAVVFNNNAEITTFYEKRGFDESGVESVGAIARSVLSNICISKNEKYLITLTDSLHIFSTISGKRIFSAEATDFFIIENFVIYNDNVKIFVYDLDKLKIRYTMVSMDYYDKGYVTILNDGFYMGISECIPKLSYVKKMDLFGFEQLDIKYNRPDKVLEAIGNTDTALINSYRKAYQKRIKKLGIDTTQFKDGYSVPESDFMNRDAIEYEQIKDKLILKIKGNDSTYTLDRFNVWVNEVPLFGLRGIKTKRFNNFDTTITITLSQGENRIETSVINVNGTESYKMPLFVKYTPAKPIEEKQYFIGIGINQFANPDYNLSWSVKDIHDLALKLKSKYPNIIIDTLFDNNVTRENILALKQKLLQLKEDDKVIVSYSGHGVLSKDFDYYLSTYSINFNNPEEKGLAYDDLESLLDNIKPRKKLMLIDACHSGEVDKEEIAKIEAAKAEMAKNGIIPRSTIKVIPKKNLGMANSFELMQSLFVNVGKGTGATIISAAGGMQYAQERGDLKNGVFTYSLIEAFNENSTLKVSELKKKVGERVIQLTNGLQKPTSRNETNNYDWVVW